MEKHLKIGEVATLTGLRPKTIRYYEDIKVIPKAKRTVVPHGMGYRLYSEEDLRRLAFVKHAKLLDLSLSEIRELLSAAEDGCCASVTPKLGVFLERKLGEIDQRISELETLRRSLTRLRQQARESVIKPQRRPTGLALFQIPCRDDACENAKP